MADTNVPVENPKYRLELTKNTKGYNWSVRAVSDDVEEIKEIVQKLDEWANEKYGS
ncbi:MAG: hypothetical protein ACOC1O_00355 [bacterium]